MPPVTKGKSPKTKKEDAERQKRILASQERILKIKRNILAIVEALLEQDISKEWFLDNCVNLCHADYNDVVQERSIEHMCGYPLCSNTIKQTLKQKYHISQATNKVYDLTERKFFCSNQCYKASNYLKAQLSPIPLYMRKEEHIKIQLLSDSNNRGSAGEEVIFHHIIPQNEIEKVYSENQIPSDLNKMLEKEVKKCADSLNDLKIKERVYDDKYIFEHQIANQKNEDDEQQNEAGSNSDIDSDDSLDEKLFPEYDNVAVLSQKHMPVPDKTKKAVLIEPLKPQAAQNLPTQVLSLNFVSDIFRDWITEDTMKFLFGEKFVYGFKADHLFEKMTARDPLSPEKLLSVKNEYINLCLKIDSLPDDDGDDDVYTSADIDVIERPGDRIDVSSKKDIGNTGSKKVFKRKTPKKKKEKSPKEKNKSVSFADDVLKSNDGESSKQESSSYANVGRDLLVQRETTPKEPKSACSLSEPSFPLVDSVSQNALRKQVLTSRLKSVYGNLLPLIGLHYTNIRQAVMKFVDTLSLTPTNIMYKPKEWKLISFVLLLILTKTVLNDLYNQTQFSKLCDDPIIPLQTNLLEVENFIEELLQPKTILSIQRSSDMK